MTGLELKTLVRVLEHLGKPFSALPYGLRDLIELDAPLLARAWDQLTIEQHREGLRRHVEKRIQSLHYAIGFHEDEVEESKCLRRELALAHDIIEKLHALEVDKTSPPALIPSIHQNAVDVSVNVTLILSPGMSQPRGLHDVETGFEKSRATNGQAGDPNVLGSDTNQEIIDAEPLSVDRQAGSPTSPGYDADSSSDASTAATGSTNGTTTADGSVAPDPDLQSQFDAEKRRRTTAGEDHKYDAMTLWARHALRIDTQTAHELWVRRSGEFTRKPGPRKGKR